MAKKKFSDQEVQDVVKEVEEVIETLLKSEAAALAKAQEVAADQKSGGDMSKCGDVMKKDETPAGPPEASASASPAAEAPAQDTPATDPAMAPEASADGAPSEAELCQAYSELSDAELQMHEKCIMQVKAAKMGGAGAPPAASAPPMAPEASASAPMAPAMSPELAMKSEKMAAELADLRKTMDVTLEAIQVALKRPSFKGVTGADVLTKSEPRLEHLSKSEVHARLLAVVKTDLPKADRQLVKDYYNNKVDEKKIAHLLKA